MAREIWKENRRWILWGLVVFVVAACFYIADVVAVRNKARASEGSISNAEVSELLALLRTCLRDKTSNFVVLIPMQGSVIYVNYRTASKKKREQLVIIFNEVVYVADSPFTVGTQVYIPTAFVDIDADGRLDQKYSVVPRTANQRLSSQPSPVDQLRYDATVRILVEYIRSKIIDF